MNERSTGQPPVIRAGKKMPAKPRLVAGVQIIEFMGTENSNF
jgi:hypothetical protein